MKKKIIFLTATRADFGKLKSLIEVLSADVNFETYLFATGMHLDEKYGFTVHEIEKHRFENIFKFTNHNREAYMDITLSKTIEGFSNYIRLVNPDLIVVHGDRIEALAGASVGALNNILVAHIEGGELSGTVDELIRHAVSKLSHTHFVANEEAKKRLMQMGELSSSIFVIGSPDMDVMRSDKLPQIDEVKKHYEIPFEEYAISLFHPVTTELQKLSVYAKNYFNAIKQSGFNYIIVYPNNDAGSEIIMKELQTLNNHSAYKIFPSIRFEAFLTLLKNASFFIGNSSAGIREAPCYGIPSVNVGTRQTGRSFNPDIIHADYSYSYILKAIAKAKHAKVQPRHLFGSGKSDIHFKKILSGNSFWKIAKQKLFADQDKEAYYKKLPHAPHTHISNGN